MKETKYLAKKPDANGYIAYTETEHEVWHQLYQRQIKVIQGRACDAFLEGVEVLQLNPEQIPQCQDVTTCLQKRTGWSVAPVEALISFEKFFNMLANKIFPAASFIRIPEEIDYLQEPDIFHEVFGHCPMLAHPAFADFTQAVGKLGVKLDKSSRVKLARLYWFTVEFGLLNTEHGQRIYGGGILSSKNETEYALTSSIPKRLPFDLLTVLRMPYRYDEMQLTYFVLDDLNDLYQLVDESALLEAFARVNQLGLLPNPHEQEPTEVRSC